LKLAGWLTLSVRCKWPTLSVELGAGMLHGTNFGVKPNFMPLFVYVEQQSGQTACSLPEQRRSEPINVYQYDFKTSS